MVHGRLIHKAIFWPHSQYSSNGCCLLLELRWPYMYNMLECDTYAALQTQNHILECDMPIQKALRIQTVYFMAVTVLSLIHRHSTRMGIIFYHSLPIRCFLLSLFYWLSYSVCMWFECRPDRFRCRFSSIPFCLMTDISSHCVLRTVKLLKLVWFDSVSLPDQMRTIEMVRRCFHKVNNSPDAWMYWWIHFHPHPFVWAISLTI